jgi:predicted DNA binding CopG/RHH family protein
MRRQYDFSKARRNPYAGRLKQSVTIRLDSTAVAYFKELAAELDMPYQTLINLYLRDCAASGRKLALKWKPSRGGRSLNSSL